MMTAQQSAKGHGALNSVRVVELGSMVAAPIAGQILADMGADVIKVEPLTGEILRGIPPVFNGVSAAFAQWNRNKRSLALNLKSPEGMDILIRLIGDADVFLHNLRVGGAADMGVAYEQLTKIKEDIIYVELTGYGAEGPYKGTPGYDMMVQALTGFMPIQGSAGEPKAVRGVIADKIAGYSAAMATLAAVIYRRNGGSGQRIDANILDSYSAFMLPDHLYCSTFVDAPKEEPFTANIFNTVQLTDGIALVYVMTDAHFKAMCDVFALEDIRNDPRFASPGARNVNQPALIARIGEACEGMTLDELVAIGLKHGLPLASINSIDDFMEDPQAKFNETFVEFDDPSVGRVKLLNGMAKFSKTPIQAKSLAPALGAHTGEVLAELGFDAAAIDDLRARKIVG